MTSTTLDLDALDPQLPRVETALHGPAHPDEFRVKVGRWGERWYHDPLPACELAEACTDAWPSVSLVKKASDRDWSWVSLERAAQYLADRRSELDGLNAGEIHARLLEVNKAGLNRASSRGTSIHHVMEALAVGGELPVLSPEAAPYLPACRKFLEEAQPEWLLSEVVAISRSCGYGGTFDAVIRINGGTYLVDWKTRKAGKHGAYPEEAWQLAAYAHADYIIVDQGGQAARQRAPKLDGAYIVSLAPEGYRLYPVDLAEAWESYKVLRLFWDRKRADHIGKPVRLQTAKTPAPAAHKFSELAAEVRAKDGAAEAIEQHRVEAEAEMMVTNHQSLVAYRGWVVGRLNTIRGNPDAAKAMAANWPDGIPGLKTGHQHTTVELDQIAAAADKIESTFGIPFGDPDPRKQREIQDLAKARSIAARPSSGRSWPEARDEINDRFGISGSSGPDEGTDMPREIVDTLIKQVDALPETTRKQLNSWAAEAHKAGRAFSIKAKPSVRRYELYQACLQLAEFGDVDMVRACLHAVAPDTGDTPVGAVLGGLTIEQTNQLIGLTITVKQQTPALVYGDDGAVRWAETG